MGDMDLSQESGGATMDPPDCSAVSGCLGATDTRATSETRLTAFGIWTQTFTFFRGLSNGGHTGIDESESGRGAGETQALRFCNDTYVIKHIEYPAIVYSDDE